MAESPFRPILCLDFDGVLHSYTSRWQGPDIIPDPPTPGMAKFLHEAVQKFDVRIYSSRSNHDGGRQAMGEWLTKHCVEALGPLAPGVLSQVTFAEGKPAAFLTIDDRALCFTGTWPSIESLLAFKPWNKA